MVIKSNVRKILAFILAVWCSMALWSQDSSGWYYGKKIRAVNFEGLNHITKMDLAGVIDPFIGLEFTDEVYLDLLNRVYALEFFDDFTPVALPGDEKGNSVIIQFTVKEKPHVSEIKFVGNQQLRTAELKEATSIKVNDIYTESKVSLDERAIRDAYLKKGYTNVKVSSSVEKSEESVSITFTISEGRSTVVKSITFSGNSVVTSKTLKGLLSMKEVGIFTKGAFQASQLEADKVAILEYYNNRGYIDAAILDVVKTETYNEENNSNELVIEFVIQEGPQYTFKDITFTRNTTLSTESLPGLVKLNSGDVFNMSKYQAGLVAVTDLYFESGYTSNYFNPQVSKNTETKEISVAFTIVERPRSHIENIVLKGNEKTKDYVILRELPIESGDIFSKTKVTNGLRNLYNLQFFSAIVPDIVAGSEENLVDLVLNLEEQSTTAIEFGVAFSGIADPDAFPVSLFFKWQDSNVFGTGKSISANTTLSTDSQSLSLGYSDSWLFGLPVSISASAGISHNARSTLRSVVLPDGSVNNTSYYMDYNQLSINLGTSVGRRWSPGYAIYSLTGGVRGELIKNFYDSSVYTPADSTLAAYQKNWGLQNSVWVAGSIDMRDLSYDPSKGWFTSQQFTWTGFIPGVEQEFFLRSDTKLEGYVTLLDWAVFESWHLKFVLAGLSSLSFLQPTPNSPISSVNKLYIDGMFTGRGWTSLYSTKKGNALWNNTVELRMPVAPGIFSLDFFFDAAVIKDTAAGFFTELSSNDVYYSFGPGFRFSLPQFPLRMLLANTFQIIDGKTVWGNGKGPEWAFVLSFNITNR